MTLSERIRQLLIGRPKDVRDPSIVHKLALIPLLAWVGLGADGLSSSAYGPEEAFRALGKHQGLALFLAVATAFTILVISYGYSRIIEQFPAGGGGYVVASKILGPRVGVVSGAALVVDYVLTITISVASGVDAMLSFAPASLLAYKISLALGGILVLTVLNLRGVKESVKAISPIFALFLVTHVAVLLLVAIDHAFEIPRVLGEVRSSVRETALELGPMGALALLVRAYSLGGGTYTGIEAVSNGVPIMREPRVDTAKRTMVLMASSLAFMASGIVLGYLLMNVQPVAGKTMNAVLIERVAAEWSMGGLGGLFVVLALLSEGGLLFIAAQAGFVDGPRVMANMATDSWLPHRFAALSERLTMRNGVLLMSGAAIAALVYTGGSVSRLVVMYSINVFVTFSLSNIAMSVYWVRHRADEPRWWRRLAVHVFASLLCLTILAITTIEKFSEGGWLTVVLTFGFVVTCLLIKRHYGLVGDAIKRLDGLVPSPEDSKKAEKLYGDLLAKAPLAEPTEADTVAILFVGGYSALGRQTLLTMLRMLPDHFTAVAFVNVAIVDSDTFKGVRELAGLEARVAESLQQYRAFAAALGLRSTTATAIGAEIAVEAEKIVNDLVERYPRNLIVAGQLIFDEDTFWNRMLHNETAFLIQRRLQRRGIPMVVLPVELDLKAVDAWRRWLEVRRARRSAPQVVA